MMKESRSDGLVRFVLFFPLLLSESEDFRSMLELWTA